MYLETNFDSEKCSESIETIFVEYFLAFFLIISQPHTMDSLFAIYKFLQYLIESIVGFKPAIPGIAEIVISFFFLNY